MVESKIRGWEFELGGVVRHVGHWFKEFRHWARPLRVHYDSLDGGKWVTLTDRGRVRNKTTLKRQIKRYYYCLFTA